MARAPHGANQPPKIIVKKVYIEGHGGHHGGAWKVAYADFVTAMMAFFLLMWLLGVKYSASPFRRDLSGLLISHNSMKNAIIAVTKSA